eukprot:7299744-Karenia_brevis.AAC.1
MEALLDGGFLTDECLQPDGSVIHCPGILKLSVNIGDGGGSRRHLICQEVKHSCRHRFHWLHGSVFQGHTKLTGKDVVGVVQCFAASKSVEQTAMDTGLNRNTAGELLDRLRMASCLVASHQRATVKFSHCQVEADETVVRKERTYSVPSAE